MAFTRIVLINKKGEGLKLVENLFNKGLTMVDLYHARGSAIGGPIDKKGNPIIVEQEILTVIIPNNQAEEIFEFIYSEAKIESETGAFLYAQPLGSIREQKLA